MNMRFRLRPALLAILLLSACAGLHAQDRSSVTTRHGAVSVIPASEERSAILFKGKPVARMNGDASLHKLTVRSDKEYVLADAEFSGLNCRHEFVLLEIGADGQPAVSAPFGKCMSLFGARLEEGKAVVQLGEGPLGQVPERVYEFVFADGRIRESKTVLGYCEAGVLAAASEAVTVTPDLSGKTVGGTGRAWFHTAPLEECRTPKVFLVPGDKVSASRETGAFVEIEYRNPKSGQVFKGWLRRDRLLDPAQ
jgi:hypothetical protein